MSKKCNRKWVKTQDVSTSKVFISLADEDLQCWNITSLLLDSCCIFCSLINWLPLPVTAQWASTISHIRMYARGGGSMHACALLIHYQATSSPPPTKLLSILPACPLSCALITHTYILAWIMLWLHCRFHFSPSRFIPLLSFVLSPVQLNMICS